MRPIRVLAVVGARPNFMKMAPVLAAMEGVGSSAFRVTLVHTDQHYDPILSAEIFRDVGLRTPDVHLGVGSGSHAVQTARILERFEPVVLEQRPEVLVVVGDVNSTAACALVAAKLGVGIAHVEAGLRSRDRSMPEEVNRVVTDALSELLFVTSRDAIANLEREGIASHRIHFVGNPMIDTLRRCEAAARARPWPGGEAIRRGSYLLLTLHRPSNVDRPEDIERIVRLLESASQRLPVVFPVHLRTRARLESSGAWERLAALRDLHLLPSLGYLDFLALMVHARLVLTDSGGVQEETTALGVPCTTLRPNTERPVTVTEGTNLLVSEDERAHLAFLDRFLRGEVSIGRRRPERWDGRAGERIAFHLHRWYRPEDPPLPLTAD